MPRPRARGGTRGWSLVQIAAEAGITRSTARAAQSRGFLSPELSALDIVLAQAAEAAMSFPDPHTRLGSLGNRDRLIVHLVRAAASDPQTTAATALVFNRDSAELTRVSPPHSAQYPAPGFPPSRLWQPAAPSAAAPLVVLPVGVWIERSPLATQPTLEQLAYPRSSSTPQSAPEASSPHDDPFGDFAITG